MKAKMFRYGEWVPETDPAVLRTVFTKQLKKAGFNILDDTEHHFKPFGWTWLALLSESHFAIHTFPEEGKSWIELSSCVLQYYQNFVSVLERMEWQS